MEQRAVEELRDKFAPHHVRAAEARKLDATLRDPVARTFWKIVECEDSLGVFLALAMQEREGKLEDFEIFKQVCAVLSDQVRRAASDNPKLKHGIRYPNDYINWIAAVRGYGGLSAQQYRLLVGALGGPSPRTIRCAAHVIICRALSS